VPNKRGFRGKDDAAWERRWKKLGYDKQEKEYYEDKHEDETSGITLACSYWRSGAGFVVRARRKK
jgi:hypothetical protein